MSKPNEKGFIEIAVGAVIVIVVLAVAVVGIVAFVNWNNNRQHTLGRGDAPTGDINRDARKVYELPDRFSNVAMFCDEYGNSVYVTTKSDYSRGIFALKDGCVK